MNPVKRMELVDTLLALEPTELDHVLFTAIYMTGSIEFAESMEKNACDARANLSRHSVDLLSPNWNFEEGTVNEGSVRKVVSR